MKLPIYLDYAATCPVDERVAKKMMEYLTIDGVFGNPASRSHKFGWQAEEAVDIARNQIADLIGADSREIVFTSGATEADNLAIKGAAHFYQTKGKHIITCKTEHKAVLDTCRQLEREGFEVTYLQPDADGHISVSDLREAIRPDTVLLTCMLANNEVGTVLPVKEFGKILKKKAPKALFHIDAVQGLARLPIKPKLWNADFISVSGHKIGAPKGIGALYIKKGTRIAPLMYGGGQERGMRPGTEAVPNIAAFGEACRVRLEQMDENYAKVQALCDRLTAGIAARFSWAKYNGKHDIPHVVNVSFPGCKSEVLLRILEMHDVYVSSGSACSKGKASHVLAAMKVDHADIDSALRISFAPSNTEEDVDALLDALEEGTARLRRA